MLTFVNDKTYESGIVCKSNDVDQKICDYEHFTCLNLSGGICNNYDYDVPELYISSSCAKSHYLCLKWRIHQSSVMYALEVEEFNTTNYFESQTIVVIIAFYYV